MKPTFPVACPGVDTNPDDPDKRLWLLATGVAGSAAALATGVPLLATFAPSERAKAAGGPVQVDISDIPPGGAKTVQSRGKPVWVVLSYVPDWRWMLEGESTPWYPTMQLWRQARTGDWPEVMKRVAQELGEWRKL